MPASHIRRLGWMLVFVGVVLTAGMAALIALFAYVLIYGGEPGVTVSFTGSPMAGIAILALFAYIFAFGVAGIQSGIYQIRRGERNPAFLRWASTMSVVFTVLGTIAGALLEFTS